MLWRFSFASASMIDTLLSRETPPTLEELLDEQDILSEVKAQNAKLVTFLSREDTTKGLLHWVVAGLEELDQASAEAAAASQPAPSEAALSSSSDAESETIEGAEAASDGAAPLEPAKADDDDGSRTPKGIGLGQGLDGQESGVDDVRRSKYPNIATEILTAELWRLTNTLMFNREQLLLPFWEAVLPAVTADDRVRPATRGEAQRMRDETWTTEDDERERKRETIRGMWMRINASLLVRRPNEMIEFIRSIPDVIERFMAQIESPAIHDMLSRIIQTEGAGVISWLAETPIIARLVELLSPGCTPAQHAIAADLLKGIVSVSAPGPPEPQTAAKDNRLVRQLAHRDTVGQLLGYVLDDAGLSDAAWAGTGAPADVFVVHPLPSIASATSSLCHVCNVLVEVVRRNNSDWAEPYLFNTMRNRLMNLQTSSLMDRQQGKEPLPDDDDEGSRTQMESLVDELSTTLAIVHLGALVATVAERFDELQKLLLHPRSQPRVASASVPRPVTMERFRIIELYAELLHSSNMSILNRADGPAYTAWGELSGGLDGLDKLGQALQAAEASDAPEEQVTKARELPVSSGSTDYSLTESDELSDDGDAPPARTEAIPEPTVPPPPSQADADRLRDVMNIENTSAPSSHVAVAATTVAPSVLSEERPAVESLPLGDRLKQQFLEHSVLRTLMDLFFDYPDNNFLHHVVYDVFQQVLNGPLVGYNRELVVNLMGEAKLVERILDVQRANDERVAAKAPRMANMGAVSLITEEVIKLLARAPADLAAVLHKTYDGAAWQAYIDGPFRDTKSRDAQQLAGGKPVLSAAGVSSAASAQGSESGSDDEDGDHATIGEPLSRTVATEGFSASHEESGVEQPSGRTIGGDSDDDDDADWLQPGNRNGSDDDFGRPDDDDDDAWGNFTSGAGDASDPFADNFAPSSSSFSTLGPSEAVTPADCWAEEFDREFRPVSLSSPNLPAQSGSGAGPSSAWPGDADLDEDGNPAIVVPNLDDSLEYDDPRPARTWGFAPHDDDDDGDAGEDLPPTQSPTLEDTEHFRGLAAATAALHVGDNADNGPSTRPPSLPDVAAEVFDSATADAASAVPAAAGESAVAAPRAPHPAAEIAHLADQSGPSPPDPALMAASSPDAPLGPGVSRDTHLTKTGMLQKEVDGAVVTVPADEVARSVEDAMSKEIQ